LTGKNNEQLQKELPLDQTSITTQRRFHFLKNGELSSYSCSNILKLIKVGSVNVLIQKVIAICLTALPDIECKYDGNQGDH